MFYIASSRPARQGPASKHTVHRASKVAQLIKVEEEKQLHKVVL